MLKKLKGATKPDQETNNKLFSKPVFNRWVSFSLIEIDIKLLV